MPRDADEPWYAEKRAMAYVSTLFAMHPWRIATQVALGDKSHVDLMVESSERRSDVMPRWLAVEVKGYRKFPSTRELNRRIAKEPIQRSAEKFRLPLLVCVVQFVKLEAVYSWLVKPALENERAALQMIKECEWHTLDKNAVSTIVRAVDVFYDALYDIAIKKTRH
jgi:hypothetical protein